MSLTVYEMLHSPYCIPVTHALVCHGIPYESVVIPNWDRREIARATDGRYYQVPVVVDDGHIVFESAEDPLAVPRFLDGRHFGGTLFPEEWSGLQEIVVTQIENEVESFSFKLCDIHHIDSMADIGERTMTIRHKERAFGKGCLDQWRANAAELRTKLEALLASYDQRLRHAPYLFGEAPIYADFALFGVLGNYTYRGWNELPAQLPALAAWHSRLGSFRPGRSG